jgi:nitroreductase
MLPPMTFSSTVTDLVRRRYSCRTYQPCPIPAECQAALSQRLAACGVGPFGTAARFALVAATEDDRRALRGLGTHGFIKHAPGFIIGAAARGPHALEDFGYLLERHILAATDLGLATCWLGGTFSKSRFAKSIAVKRDEIMPAVSAVGYAEEGCRATDRTRQRARSDFRLPADRLFFDNGFDQPLRGETAGAYADVLEAVRWAPSASNKQPWRVVHSATGWHFYLERTKGYGTGSLVFTLLRLADLQRVDLGIAMCHFELAALERGLAGEWVLEEPPFASGGREFVATWHGVPA